MYETSKRYGCGILGCLARMVISLNNDECSNLSQQKCISTNNSLELFEEIKLATKQLYDNFIYSGENKNHHLIFTKCLIEKFENYFFGKTQNDENLKNLENLIEGVYQEVFYFFGKC
ncbi:unnamed protein product [Meloidogyne enterolobii]|uniref:Uncharacterized protein n=1 Tax=Meloidogyne enterolobii TaxID=390850 RepID=A0ACB1A9E7_MELEN